MSGRYRMHYNNSNDSWVLPFLTLLFVTLKLNGVINWSWLWVLSPLWIGFLIGVVLYIVIVIIAHRKE